MKRLVLLCAFLVACDGSLTAPDNSVRIGITADMKATWSQMESCSGLKGNIDAVEFYIVPGLDRDEGISGLTKWNGPWKTQIELDPFYFNDNLTLKHEIMHALYRKRGHPTHYFKGVCGNLIDPWNDKH